MKKRVLSVLLTAAMLATVMNFSVFADEENGSTHITAAQCLKNLGGAEYDETADFDAEVTRGEFCGMMAKYFNLSSSDGAATTPFIDVELTDEYFGEIRTLYDLGYISGSENRRFYPKRSITVSEAVTIMVTALGYKYEAEERGGYPSGFISTAAERKIFTGTADYNAPMTLGEIYQLLYDCLDVPVLVFETENGRDTYKSSKENTVLWVYFKAKKQMGIVTATKYTALTSPKGRLSENNIAVDDNVYYSGQDYSGMLGMNIMYYISYRNSDDGEIVYMSERNNTVTEIPSGDIESISSGKISYYKGENKTGKTISISEDIDVIYNGRALTGYGTIERLKPSNGKMVLIDNNSDGKADVMDITEYKSYYVSALDKTVKTVYDYNQNRSISLNDSYGTVELYGADNGRMKFSSLKKNTLITTAKSAEESDYLIRAYVSETKIEGAAESVSEDEYVIAGSSYKKAADMTKDIPVGKRGIFMLDINGRISAFITELDTDYRYALVYNVIHDASIDELSLSLFTTDEKFLEYKLGTSISLDKSAVRSDSPEGIEIIKGKIKTGMVIRYKLNDDGEKIAAAETPLAMTEDDSGAKQPEDSENFRTLYEGSSFKYRNGLLDGKLIINDETVIFSVPKEGNWRDKTLFGTLTPKSFSGGTSYSKNYRAYTTGENAVNVADVMVIEDMTRGSIGNGTNMVLVTSLSTGVDTDNNVCTVINGISAGNTAEYYCQNESVISGSGVAKGDIIRVGFDSARNVNRIQKIYNSDGTGSYGALLAPNEGVSENTSSFDSEFRVAIGRVIDLDGTYMKFSMQKKSGDSFYEDMSLCQISGASIVKYERDNPYGTPSPCSVNDILRGDTVIIRMSLAAAKEIIILRYTD